MISSRAVVSNRSGQAGGELDGIIDEHFQMNTCNAGVGKKY
jgi:hypothetical protein